MIIPKSDSEKARLELREDRIASRRHEAELERRRHSRLMPSVIEVLLFLAALAGVVLLVVALAGTL